MEKCDARGSLAPRSAWRWFPWAVVGAMGLVVVANASLIYFALHSFPGRVEGGGFDLSNRYDQVLESVRQQAALGWELRVVSGDAGRAVLTLADRSGAALRGARIEATAERVLGATETTHLTFRDAGDGHYVADAVLTAPGQWELRLAASVRGQTIAATRRIVVPASVALNKPF